MAKSTRNYNIRELDKAQVGMKAPTDLLKDMHFAIPSESVVDPRKDGRKPIRADMFDVPITNRGT